MAADLSKLEERIRLLDAALGLVREEVLRAVNKHAPMNSAHEGYSVILEELDELWEEVRAQSEARSLSRMLKEAIQTAAMGIRFATDVCAEELAAVIAEMRKEQEDGR